MLCKYDIKVSIHLEYVDMAFILPVKSTELIASLIQSEIYS